MDAQERYASGSMVKGNGGRANWKHMFWRNVPKDEVVPLIKETRKHHACMGTERWTGKPLDTERWEKNPDGTWNYESVYACGPDAPYGLEDWDGVVVIGPNRRDLRAKYPRGTYVEFYLDGQPEEGYVLRHNRKTITVSILSRPDGWVRITWAGLERVLA